MKNKILNIFKTIFLIILIIPMCIYEVKADNAEEENAGSSGVTDSGGSVSGDHGSYTTKYVGLRITLVDSSGNRIAGTVSVDYLSTDSLVPGNHYYYSYERKARKEVVAAGTTNWKTISDSGATFNKLNFANFLSEGFAGGTYFENYFDDMDSTQFKKILNTLAGGSYDSVTSYDALIKDGEVCRTVQEGYLLIEPIVKVWIGGTVQKHYFGTATEIIHVVKSAPTSAVSDIRWNTIEYRFPYAIYLSNDGTVRTNLANKLGFVPITPPKGLYTGTNFSAENALLKNVAGSGKIYGVGVGAFKLSDSGIDFSCSKCWTTEVSCDTTACVNTNTNNERTCKKTVKEIECEFVEDETKVNASGEKTFTYGSGCNLYCTEKATVSYPGNVYPRVQLGTNLVWPTPKGTGLYPLTTSATLSCQIVPNEGVSMGTCISQAYTANLTYQNSKTGTVKYNDLANDVSLSLKGECDPASPVIESSGKVTIVNNCKYSLADTTYNAFNKETLKAVNVQKDEYEDMVGNLVLNYQGVLPILGYDRTKFTDLAKVLDGTYNLQITNLSLGHKDEFTDDLSEYICNYQVTENIEYSCTCPPGTTHAGKNLAELLSKVNVSGNTTTCAEAKLKYCDTCEYESCICYKGTEEIDLEPCLDQGKTYDVCALENECVPKDKVCPDYTTFPGLSLESCLSKGNSEQYCITNECYPYCPANSTYAGKSIDACVSDEIAKGKDKYAAYDKCVEENCYVPCTGTNCIIYRTISLETPFVGKKADTSLWSASGTKSLMNFMHTAGVDPTQGLSLYRFPGANWNSPILVKEKIWYNRGYKASDIYQDATPLYTINLDPTSIKKIRDYNENHEYSDFTLDCTDGAYCISNTFLRSGIKNADGSDILDYDAAASTCANASNKTTFISCYNK